jgi:hypothetical protein
MFDQITFRRGEKFFSGMTAIKQRPELAARVGLVVAMWATIELRLSELLSYMLHADARVGATLFTAITSEGGRLAMTKAIAQERLSVGQLTEYDALQKRIRKVGGYRDAMCHGIWCVSDARPDTLILLDSRSVAQFFAHKTAHEAQMPTAPEMDLPDYSASEYGDTEFSFVESEIRALAGDLIDFEKRVQLSQQQRAPNPTERVGPPTSAQTHPSADQRSP